MGDLAGALIPSAHGDNSIDLLVSLKMGKLGEAPVKLSMVPGSAANGQQGLDGSPWSLVVQRVSPTTSGSA